MAEYTLTRTAPTGEETEQGPFSTVLDAATAARTFLREQDVATPVEARWYASYLAGCPLDMDVTHVPSKYSFRIEGGGQS